VLYVLKRVPLGLAQDGAGKRQTRNMYLTFADFIGGFTIRAICVDPSATSFKAECKKQQIWNVIDADNDVLDGIRGYL